MKDKNLWESLVVPKKYKKWINPTPDSKCKICSWNASVWWIKANVRFPSWDMQPPAHPNCDCQINYITSTEKLDKNIPIDTMKVWDATEEFENILEEWKKDFDWLGDFFSYGAASWSWKKYDIKRREEFLNKADEELYVIVYWIKVRLDELGNFMIWRNMTFVDLWYNTSVFLWNIWESAKNFKNPDIHIKDTFKIPEDEKRDRRFYYSWAMYWKLEKL